MSASVGTVLKLKNRSEMRVLARLDMNEPGLPQPTHSPLKNPQLRTREIVRHVMDHRTPVSSRQAKIRWLQANHVLWDGFSPDDRQNWSHIIKLMKAAGLVAATTYTFDVNLPSLIADAHGH